VPPPSRFVTVRPSNQSDQSALIVPQKNYQATQKHHREPRLRNEKGNRGERKTTTPTGNAGDISKTPGSFTAN
jgi:hypothetical protein